jgi:hypothetical protein
VLYFTARFYAREGSRAFAPVNAGKEEAAFDESNAAFEGERVTVSPVSIQVHSREPVFDLRNSNSALADFS